MLDVILGFFAFSNPQRELYMTCAAAWSSFLMSILALGGGGMILIIVGVPIFLAFLFAVFGSALLTSLMSFTLVLKPTASAGLFFTIGIAYHALAFLTLGGLILVIINRHLAVDQGAKEIFMNSWYFVFPSTFALFGIYFWAKTTTRRSSVSSE